MGDKSLGNGIAEGLREVLAWKRGETALEVVNVAPLPPARIKAIRRKAAKSTREFEAMFGIAAATMNNWEQGRRSPDPAARLLLKAIEADPAFVARVARSG